MDKDERINHINGHGGAMVKIAIEYKLWECGDEDCSMHIFWNGFSDEEINACVKLLSRFMHSNKDLQTQALFSHLVGEQQKRAGKV